MSNEKILVDLDFGTKPIFQRNGLLEGRETNGVGDRTAVLRGVKTGRVYGRSPKVPKKIPKSMKAIIKGKRKNIIVDPYWKQGKFYRGTIRRI